MYTIIQPKPAPKKRPAFKKLLIPAVALLVVASVIATLELTDTTHWFHKEQQAAPVTGGPATKVPNQPPDNTPNPQSGDGSATGGDQGTDGKHAGDDNPDTKLKEPSGPFVSNHNPNLDGNPRPAALNSVCNTTSGASCQIIFTKGSVTKSLPAQTTDKGGATYWNGWKPQDIGLTEGEWKITAKATLGSQATTADDAIPFKVSP